MFRLLLVVVFCGVLVSSCFNPPEYPDVPNIVYKDVAFAKGGVLDDGSPAADSVIIKLTFKDGDGDIGISNNEFDYPFHDKWYFFEDPSKISDPDDACAFSSPENGGYKCWNWAKQISTAYVRYATRSKTGYYDSLRGFKEGWVKPFNCTNWEIKTEKVKPDDPTERPFDTVYFQLNPHYNNIFVEFQTKNGDGSYTAFNPNTFFTSPICGIRIFDGRIPILAEDLKNSTPLEGEIRYAIPSVSFTALFGGKILRLKVSIEDRALHRSNTIFTPDFNLAGK